MKFQVTYHARDRLEMRGISLEDIKYVLRNSKSRDQHGDACRVEGTTHSGLLRVVYTKRGNRYTIITAYYVD